MIAVAGQEVYYLSHSVHFTQRCLYILTWTPPQPASDAGALSPPVTLEQLKDDLRLWLQMLAQHVPDAKVLLVGTRDDESDKYQSVREQVEAAVDAEMEQLNSRVRLECNELQRMKDECESEVVAKSKDDWREAGKRFDVADGGDGDIYENEMKWWWDQSVTDSGLEEWQRRIARQVFVGMQRAQMLRERFKLMKEGKAQLQRVAKNQRFTLDCLNGRGVAELQRQLSGLCRDHVSGMGDVLPEYWQVALDALQKGGACDPLRKADAIHRVREAVPALSSTEVWTALQFWADLGRIFVYGNFVLPDPLRLLDLIKPLLHHDPPFLLSDACSQDDKKLLLSSCRESFSLRSACSSYLRLLKAQAVLDRRLLPLLPAWGQDPSFHQTMLDFLAECHLICLTESVPDPSAQILVTARSRDLPSLHAPYPAAVAGLSADDLSLYDALQSKHAAMHLRFNAVLDNSDSCRVLFVVSRYHIGIISRLQAFIHRARPSEVSVVFNAAKDSIFMCRDTPHVESSAQSCCAVRVLPFCDDADVLSAFRKMDGPMCRESDRRSKCGIIIAANDLALLTFMVRRVEDTLKRWSICAVCECYVEGPSKDCPFIRFDGPSSADSCALPLSAVLSGNLWETVVPGVQMRHLFPSHRRCAMFLSYSSDDWENTGTRHACETIRNGFQEAALCSVWMDRTDASYSRPWQQLVREGLRTANIYVLCLTPLYFTRPNCLAELNDILMLVETLPDRKRLIVLPLHPAMTVSGRRRILEFGFVVLPDFRASTLSHSIVRVHFLSSASMDLLRRLSAYDTSEADPLAIQCLNTEPWLSSSSGGQPCDKWNGAEATFDMCRAMVSSECQSLGSLLVCADDRPIQVFPFLAQSNSASKPPSLEALDPAVSKSSIVDPSVGFEPIFHLFRKQHAIHLIECGVASHQLCDLVQNSSRLQQSLPLYLQRLLDGVDFAYARNSFGGSEDLATFLDWTATPPLVKGLRKVVFRVEGPDDKLLLNAIVRLKFPMMQRPQGHLWSDFSYNSDSAFLKIRDRQHMKDVIHEVGIVSIIRGLQATAGLKSFKLSFLDLDDQDLKAFETSPKQRPEKDLCLFTWRWGRAIENYMLPVTAPAVLYVRGYDLASELTAEVFKTIAWHFFPVVAEKELEKRKLCGHKGLKFKDLIGPGWKAWSSLLQSPDVNVHKDKDTLAAAETLKYFSITLLGVAKLLVERHASVYGRNGSRADEWLLHLAAVRREVHKGKYDKLSAQGKAEAVDWKKACTAILALPAVGPGVSLNCGDADEAALWFNLPAVCSFLANLCRCSWLSGALDDPADAGRVKDVAASALCLVQHALCVLLLGCDPAKPAPQCTLFFSADCSCFLPLVGEKSAVHCFTCGREEALHTLPECHSSSTKSTDFLVELCRVGSVGWDSHKFMKAVYGRTHLGVNNFGENFSEANVDESHRLYEQHIRPLLYGGTVDSQCFRDFTLPALPDVTVYAIEGHMKPLLEQRRAEFDRLCSLLSQLIDAPISPAASPAPSSSGSAVAAAPTSAVVRGSQAASSAVTLNLKATGGGGSAAAVAPQARPALHTKTAQDVATAIGLVGPPYKVYEQSIVGNGVDGNLVAQLVGLPEAEALSFLESLGIPPPAHSRRVLMLFRSWILS
jgi:hypothetical protein